MTQRLRAPRRGRGTTLLPAVLLLLALLLPGCAAPRSAAGQAALPGTLRVGVVPNIAPDQQRARYAPLAEHLSRALGTQVELFVASTYAGVVTALAAGQVDVAYLGGLTYAQAERQVPLVPLVTEVDRATGGPEYLSAVVVPDRSPVRSVAGLLDRRASFAFGDPSSTSGSLYPRLMLTEAGARCSSTDLTACPPLGEVRFTGGHDAVALAVAGGRVDAGGLELRILRRLEQEGKVPSGALRVVAERRVPGYPWVAREALGAEGTDRVRQAFLDIRDPALLDLLRAERYVPVRPEDYDEVRRSAAALGLLR